MNKKIWTKIKNLFKSFFCWSLLDGKDLYNINIKVFLQRKNKFKNFQA